MVGHDGVYGYLYGETYVATQEHIDKKEDMPMWKIMDRIRLSKLDHNMRPIKNDDNEVTHKVFFGENIKRLIRALKKKKTMKIQKKLVQLIGYYSYNRCVGHTALLKEGAKHYDKEKFILATNKENWDFLECKPTEVISVHNLEALRGTT